MIEINNVLLTDTRGNKLDKATSGVAARTVDLHSRYPLIWTLLLIVITRCILFQFSFGRVVEVITYPEQGKQYLFLSSIVSVLLRPILIPVVPIIWGWHHCLFLDLPVGQIGSLPKFVVKYIKSLRTSGQERFKNGIYQNIRFRCNSTTSVKVERNIGFWRRNRILTW